MVQMSHLKVALQGKKEMRVQPNLKASFILMWQVESFTTIKAQADGYMKPSITASQLIDSLKPIFLRLQQAFIRDQSKNLLIKQPKFERLDKLLSKTRKNAVRLQLPMLQRKRHLRKERKKLLLRGKKLKKNLKVLLLKLSSTYLNPKILVKLSQRKCKDPSFLDLQNSMDLILRENSQQSNGEKPFYQHSLSQITYLKICVYMV